jgi:death-on-curing protein
MPTYLSLGDVIALHALVMERTGASPMPLRDDGLLESAIMQPQMAAHYADADTIHQAALLAVGISQAQAFMDGNKRTAFAAMDVFLRINDFRFQGDPIELAQMLEGIADRQENLETATIRFVDWLREHTQQVED